MTCQTIITRALQRLRVLAAGEVPSDPESADGLLCLQNLYDGWVASGMFGRLTDYLATEDYEAKEGERVRYATGVTVTLPTEIDEDGVDRPPRNRAVIVTVNSTTAARVVNIYNADLGAWQTVQSLAVGDVAPLESLGKEGLACCLAMDLADEFGAQPTPMTIRTATAFKMALSQRFDGTRRETEMQAF